ncbi:MFS transporter [Castellaniella sp. FW104-16D08]|uniref:MFS transporter n=1 Tax=unclassified Castellaniella TaxID=2617606 RepID=UPI0033159691
MLALFTPPARKGPVPRLKVFAIISVALLMMSIDSTIVATVLHALQSGLDTSINWAGWTLTAYSFGFVLMLPVTGKLSERYGHRRVFLVAVCVFTTTSLLCALAQNIYVLIVLRALQAAGGAGLTPSATGIVVNHFGSSRDRAVSLFGSIFPVGAMIGPIFGGLFVKYWTWRGVFFVNVPLGLLVLLFAFHHIPFDRDGAATRHVHMDVLGMVLMGVGLLAGMLTASSLGEDGVPVFSVQVWLPLLVCLASLVGFVRHVGRVAVPFIAPKLIYGEGFGAVNLANSLFGGISIGIVALIPLYATNRYGIDALSSGTLLVAQGAAAILFSVLAAFALRRTGFRRPIRFGSVVIALGMGMLALPPPWSLSPYFWLALSAFLVGAGGGIINPASRNAGLQLATEHSATLAALRSASLQTGSILTISVATALLSAAANPGYVQAVFCAASGLVLLLSLPLINHVPEHHGVW